MSKLSFLDGYKILIEKLPKYTAFTKPFTVPINKHILDDILNIPNDKITPEC